MTIEQNTTKKLMFIVHDFDKANDFENNFFLKMQNKCDFSLSLSIMLKESFLPDILLYIKLNIELCCDHITFHLNLVIFYIT